VAREEWQVLGRSATDLWPEEVARHIEIADRWVLATGRMTGFELEVVWPGHPTRWMWMTITPWQDVDGRVVGVVSVSRDITEQRAAETNLRAMQADLLRATRLSAMGAMASGLAHELNQPLAAATNYLNASARLLERGAGGNAQGPPELLTDLRLARGAVADAAQQLLRSGAIVRRLRDFVERGEAELQPQDVSELIRGTIELARADGITQGVELQMVLAPYTALVLIDITQMQQVLLNLIRNAAEAIRDAVKADPDREHGIIVLAAVARPPDGTCIDVIDNGPGLPPDIAENLFQPFMSTKPGGMGIGLTICHTIVEGHGGQLQAQIAIGGGTRFRITLPPVPQSGAPK
jgi:two-component system sensor kinase FixL